MKYYDCVSSSQDLLLCSSWRCQMTFWFEKCINVWLWRKKKAPHRQCRDSGSGSSTTFNSHSTKRATFNSHILLPSPIPLFLIVFIVPHFLCSSLWRMAAAVPPRRCISSGGWTAGACFNYVKAQLKTTQYESYINLQLHTIMLQSGLKRTWRCAFRTNVK